MTNTIGRTPAFAGLNIRLFGCMDVQLGGIDLPKMRSRKSLYLLALLVLKGGREVEREWLVSALWPDSEPKLGFYNLRRALYELRQALGEYNSVISSPTPHSLRIELSSAVRTDVIRFKELLAEGGIDNLREAVGLYCGHLLVGCTEEWVTEERAALDEDRLAALRQLAAAAAQEGNSREAISWYWKLTARDPLSEENYRRLMELLAEIGDDAAVAAVYRDLRLMLHREINAEPAPETTALFQSLRQKMRESAAKFVTSPVHKERETAAGRLPRSITSFVGRDKELNQIRTLLETHRLVTLVGTGGVGKTRTALRIAEIVTPDYKHGAWFVDLAGISKAALVRQTVARALGVMDTSGGGALEALCASIQNQHMLIVLDNCEHLLPTCVEISEALLAKCPYVKILATSRQALGHPNEAVFNLSPLAIPEPRNLPRQNEGLEFAILQNDAVRLFVDRACATMPAFELTRENAPSVMRIVRLLDGIPLAIELAAARVRSISPKQIVVKLNDRFGLLTRGSASTNPHHQTLTSAIAWSYSLLSWPQESLFRRISVFAGGWTLEAAEQICPDDASCPCVIGKDQIVDLLDDLIERSLISAADEDGERRYRVLESIREFAIRQLLDNAEADDYVYRHARWFTDLAEQSDPTRIGEPNAGWLDRMEREHDNFRAAMSNSGEDDSLPRIARSLYWFWNIRGYWTEGRDRLEHALKSGFGCKKTRADCLNGLGILAWKQSDYAHARQAFEEGIALQEELGDRLSKGSMMGNLGLVYCDLGDYEASKRCHLASLEIDRSLDNGKGVAARLANLGLVSMYQNHLPEADSYFGEAIAIGRQHNVQRTVASCLMNRALVRFHSQDYTGSDQDNLECEAISRELGHKGLLAFAHHGLGMTACYREDFSTARSHYAESLALRREIGDAKSLTDSYNCIGDMLLMSGNPRGAVRLWGAASRIREEIAAPITEVEIEEYRTNLAHALNQLGEAVYNAAWSAGISISDEEIYNEAMFAVGGPSESL